MSDATFKLGDFVINPKMPEWGTGEVLEYRGDGKFIVNFAATGTKIMTQSVLIATTSPESICIQSNIAKRVSIRNSQKHINDYKQRFRNDPLEAKQVITSMVHNHENVVLLMSQLLESIGIANSIAPTAWGVTLYNNGFRLNVGPVEALYFFDSILVVNLIGTYGLCHNSGKLFTKCKYSIPGPHCAFQGSIEEYKSVQNIIKEQHVEFIQRASEKPSGGPREGSSWASSNSPGIIEFAQRLCFEEHAQKT